VIYFLQKIATIPLTKCFKECTGKEASDDALKFIIQKYTSCNKSPTRQLYTHITCATDKNNVERVFNDIQHILVESNLDVGGF